jgi:hypothetical protein
MLRAELREEQSQEVVGLRHRRHGRFAAATRDALLDGDRRRHAGDEIDLRLLHLLDKGACIDGHGVEEAALAFREDEIEGEGGFATAAEAGDDDEFVARDVEGDVLEIVLAGASDADRVGGGSSGL